jgi:hypothetical protein
MYAVRDPDYAEAPADTFASELRKRFDAVAGQVDVAAAPAAVQADGDGDGVAVVTAEQTTQGELVLVEEDPREGVDVMARIEDEAIAALERDESMRARLDGDGYPWGGLIAFFEGHLPELLEDRRDFAHHLIPKALNRVLGDQNRGGWHTFKHPSTNKTWVKAGSG